MSILILKSLLVLLKVTSQITHNTPVGFEVYEELYLWSF